MPATEGQVRLRARVAGRVQGVGYRYWLLRRAIDDGLTGWAMNLPDERTVEVVAEGDPAAIDSLERALWTGPAGARVDTVELQRGPASGEYRRFSVHRE
jgi:acylphosphatase